MGCHFLLQGIVPTQGSSLVSCIVVRFSTIRASREATHRANVLSDTDNCCEEKQCDELWVGGEVLFYMKRSEKASLSRDQADIYGKGTQAGEAVSAKALGWRVGRTVRRPTTLGAVREEVDRSGQRWAQPQCDGGATGVS